MPSAAPLAPIARPSPATSTATYAPPAPASRKTSNGAQKPWRRSSRNPNSAMVPRLTTSYPVESYANSVVNARHGSSRRPVYAKSSGLSSADLSPIVTRTEASTSAHTAHGRWSARMPGISPGRSRGSCGRERARRGAFGTPPRSSLGARF